MTRPKQKILVVGAGVAGIAATKDLVDQGLSVTLVEARTRLGGRLWTLHPPGLGASVELGPEFLHGKATEARALLPRAKNLRDSQYVYFRGKLTPEPDFWGEIESRLGKMKCHEPDRPVASFWNECALPDAGRALLHAYLEGFNAADIHQMSECALAEETRRAGDDELGHPAEGYDSLLPGLTGFLTSGQVDFALGSRVRKVEWEQGNVKAWVEGAGGLRIHEAEAAIFTLPASFYALDPQHASFVEFSPPPPGKAEAAGGIALGPVYKVVTVFSEPPWDLAGADISFLHSPELTFGTRWAWNSKGPCVITSWSGGSRAERLKGKSSLYISTLALRELAETLGRPPADLAAGRIATYFHDWTADPYSLGAYSYVKTGFQACRERLAEPVANTLFYAGEATCADGSSGTVHGAIRSGRRAARECVKAIYDKLDAA